MIRTGFAGARFHGGELAELAAIRVEHPRAARLDRYCRLALSAAQGAVDRAARDAHNERPDLGVFVASQLGCFGANVDHQRRLHEQGVRGVSPLVFPATVPSAAAAEIAIAFGALGPNVTLTGGAESAAGILRLGLRSLLDGECRAALIGVADAWHERLAELGFEPGCIDGAAFIYLSRPDERLLDAALARLREPEPSETTAVGAFAALIERVFSAAGH
jgi:3-oxoacyl-(acyl-carrier-protein) synthase